MTNVDFAQNSQNGQNSERYDAQVKQWARSNLEQMASFAREGADLEK